jgi:hypothetical protein
MLAREFRSTLPKPSRGAKTPDRRDGHFVTRITGGRLIRCEAAKGLWVEAAMVATTPFDKITNWPILIAVHHALIVGEWAAVHSALWGCRPTVAPCRRAGSP